MILTVGKSRNSGYQAVVLANSCAAYHVSSDGVSFSVYIVGSSKEPPALSNLPMTEFFNVALGTFSSNAPKKVSRRFSIVAVHELLAVNFAFSSFSQVISSYVPQLLEDQAEIHSSTHCT